MNPSRPVRALDDPAFPLSATDDDTVEGSLARLVESLIGSYLAGPLWNEEGILYAELDPQRLYHARQRFDPAGHYHRPDVFRFSLPLGS